MSAHTKGPIPSHLDGISVNQRRALDRGLAALEAMADIWAAEIRLTPMSEKMAAFPESTRAEVIYSMTHQAFIEGAYRHFLDCKYVAGEELNAARALLREVLEELQYEAKDKVRAYLDACDKPGGPT